MCVRNKSNHFSKKCDEGYEHASFASATADVLTRKLYVTAPLVLRDTTYKTELNKSLLYLELVTRMPRMSRYILGHVGAAKLRGYVTGLGTPDLTPDFR